ncbi:Mucin-associated surface protein (MASP), subgroup S017 [Trypanosoma cruzi]|nr:Mucin-associated surface protein (MASP), subgroup S017 [Trypanosoma cruzi]
MAMMMTGRVLLVCALCVLWCGAGGRCDGEDTAVSGSGGESPLASKGIETSPQGTQELRRGAGGVEGNVPSTSSEDEVEEDEDDDDDDKGTEDGEGKRTERQSVQGGKAAQDPDSREKNLGGSDQEIHQSIAPAGDISHSDTQESNAIPTQTEIEEKKEPDENTPAVENALKTVNGENSLLGGIAGGNLPSSPEDGVDSREKDGEDPKSGGRKNDPPPETAATPQSHQEEGSGRTGEDKKATTVESTANTNHTTTPGDSDGSTAASHTTFPLLLLLVVVCAAAAAVVAA